MSAPLYFFPDHHLTDILDGVKFRPVILEKFGLKHVFGDVTANNCSRFDLATTGPGEKSGAIFVINTAGQPPARAGHHPDFQTWTLVKKDPQLWIGIDNESPPKPVDLARSSMIPGWSVALGDGNEWLVPVSSSLPRDIYVDADGETQMALTKHHQAIWDDTRVAWDIINGYFKTEEGVSYRSILDLCLKFLAVNYRIGHYEQAVLRLVNTSQENWLKILGAACDIPFFQEVEDAEKKTDPEPQE